MRESGRATGALQRGRGTLIETPWRAQVMDVIGEGLSGTEINLGFIPPEAAQTIQSILAHTKFPGSVSLTGAPHQIILAALGGLCHNKTVSGVSLYSEVGQTYGAHQPLVPEVLRALTTLLVHNSTIKTLLLHDQDAGSKADLCAFFTTGVAQNKGLTTLDVENLGLGNAGVTALGQALRQNRTLTSLRMDRNSCELEGWKQFRGCLYGNKKLRDCPLPEIDLRNLIAFHEGVIMRGEQEVSAAKRNIKIACRGGRVKPWLGNPALKQRSLEELRAAKRRQGAAQRFITKVKKEVPQIWQEIDCNNGRFQAKYAEKFAREDAKRAAADRKQLQLEAKHQSKKSSQLQRWSSKNKNKKIDRERRDRRDSNDSGGYYGGGYYGGGYYGSGHSNEYCYRCSSYHSRHYDSYHSRYYYCPYENNHDYYSDDDRDWERQEEIMQEETEVADLQEQV